jgi:hypothetical protein
MTPGTIGPGMGGIPSGAGSPPAPGASPNLAQQPNTNAPMNPPALPSGNAPTHAGGSGTNGQSQPGSAATGTAAGGGGSAPSNYAECMALWNPATTQLSREDWSRTCQQAGMSH